MTESQILLTSPESPLPRRAHIPTGRSLRWRSLVEIEDHVPIVTVFVSQRAYVRFCAHAGSDLDNEVGGWLIGKWRADRETGEQYVIVEATLPAHHIRHGGAFLTFTQESQVALYGEFQARFPNRELVGWYHTHPRMGIFLSEYDTWLHRNFFPEHYQVALVIEPHSSTGGFFIRRQDGILDNHHYYGFFELNDARRRSVVHWRNMIPELTEAELISNQGDEI